MKVQITIPDDHPMAVALETEAGERCRTKASLCLDYVRTQLNKRSYNLPPITPDKRRQHRIIRHRTTETLARTCNSLTVDEIRECERGAV